MGNDGGTIARRQDIKSLHSYSLSSVKSKPGNLCDLLTVCGLLGVDLTDGPLVSDYLGHLYSKEKIIEHILASKTNPHESSSCLPHAKLINDFVNLVVTWRGGHLACPVTRESENVTFAYSRCCGCLVSSKALKKPPGSARSGCPVCSVAYDPDLDAVFVNPNNEAKLTELNLMTYKRLQDRDLSHNKKVRKSSKKSLKKSRVPDKSVIEPGATTTRKRGILNGENREPKSLECGNQKSNSLVRVQLLADAPLVKKPKV